jgi:hypothetical protein
MGLKPILPRGKNTGSGCLKERALRTTSERKKNRFITIYNIGTKCLDGQVMEDRMNEICSGSEKVRNAYEI